MNDLLEFMTSEEMMIVGAIILIASILALIVFLIEKGYYKRKIKNNTKLINQMVEEEQEEEAVLPVSNQTVVVPAIKVETNECPKVETLNIEEEKPLVIPIEEFNEEEALKSEVEAIPNNFNNEKELVNDEGSIQSIYKEVKEEVEMLHYTDPEPNKEEAQEELRKVTEELIKKENDEDIDLTKFEEEQEENAIISLDELMQKSEVLYQQNEATQYQDEGDEPISLKDLEQRMKNIKVEIEELDNEPMIDERVVKPIQEVSQNVVVEKPKVTLDDLNTIKDPIHLYREDVTFKSSPIISPIFGIEESKIDTNIELENTANYDKLDEEIKKTNKFLATLKELQKKLD